MPSINIYGETIASVPTSYVFALAAFGSAFDACVHSYTAGSTTGSLAKSTIGSY